MKLKYIDCCKGHRKIKKFYRVYLDLRLFWTVGKCNLNRTEFFKEERSLWKETTCRELYSKHNKKTELYFTERDMEYFRKTSIL